MTWKKVDEKVSYYKQFGIAAKAEVTDEVSREADSSAVADGGGTRVRGHAFRVPYDAKKWLRDDESVTTPEASFIVGEYEDVDKALDEAISNLTNKVDSLADTNK